MLRLLQINCLDLFLFLDQKPNKSLTEYSEEEWQKLTYSFKGLKPLTATKDLAKTIIRQNPDIIVMNEVGGVESIKNFNYYFLNNEYQEYMINGESDRGIDTGFLVKKHLSVKLEIFHKHPKTKFKFSRSVNKLIIYENAESKLQIFGVHLKSKWDESPKNLKAMEVRYHEVKNLLSLANENKGIPTIIAGDFNGNAQEKDRDFEFDSLQDHGFRDIHDIMGHNLEQRFSYIRYYDENNLFSQIDYIFLSKDLHSKIIEAKRITYAADDLLPPNPQYLHTFPSDHFPQFVILDI